MFIGKTNQLGIIGELVAIQEFIKFGFSIYTPLSGKEKFDFIACKDSNMIRVQVKSTSTTDKYGSYTIQLKHVGSNRTCNKIQKFDNSLCDVLALYIQPLDIMCFLHSSDINSTCTIAFRKTKINSKTNVIHEYVDLNKVINKCIL